MITIDGVVHLSRAGMKISALYRQDQTLPFGCFSGRCGSCLVRVISGTFGPVWARERCYLAAHGFPVERDLGRMCQTMPLGHAVVEIFHSDRRTVCVAGNKLE